MPKVVLCIYQTPLPWAGCDIRLEFKRSTAGLKLEVLPPGVVD